MVDGAVRDRAGEVDAGVALPLLGARGGGVEKRHGHAEMPLADRRGAVAVGLEQGPQGRPVRREQGRAVAAEHAARQPGAPRVAPGEERVAGRRAHGGRRVGVDEAHALAGEAVDVRGGDARLRMHGPDVAPAEVVGEDEHHVRRDRGAVLCVRGQGRRARRGDQECQQRQSHAPWFSPRRSRPTGQALRPPAAASEDIASAQHTLDERRVPGIPGHGGQLSPRRAPGAPVRSAPTVRIGWFPRAGRHRRAAPRCGSAA